MPTIPSAQVLHLQSYGITDRWSALGFSAERRCRILSVITLLLQNCSNQLEAGSYLSRQREG